MFYVLSLAVQPATLISIHFTYDKNKTGLPLLQVYWMPNEYVTDLDGYLFISNRDIQLGQNYTISISGYYTNIQFKSGLNAITVNIPYKSDYTSMAFIARDMQTKEAISGIKMRVQCGARPEKAVQTEKNIYNGQFPCVSIGNTKKNPTFSQYYADQMEICVAQTEENEKYQATKTEITIPFSVTERSFALIPKNPKKEVSVQFQVEFNRWKNVCIPAKISLRHTNGVSNIVSQWVNIVGTPCSTQFTGREIVMGKLYTYQVDVHRKYGLQNVTGQFKIDAVQKKVTIVMK